MWQMSRTISKDRESRGAHFRLHGGSGPSEEASFTLRPEEWGSAWQEERRVEVCSTQRNSMFRDI